MIVKFCSLYNLLYVIEMNQQLQYVILNSDKIEGQGSIMNISQKKSGKKWNMKSLDDFIIFVIKFVLPSKVCYIDMKGFNTYIMTLIFKDQSEKFLLEKQFKFTPSDESKIVEVYDRPLVTYVEVKLLNSPNDRKKIGLSYLNFLGKAEQPPPPPEVEQIKPPLNIRNSQISVSSSKNRKNNNPSQQIQFSINIDDQQVQVVDEGEVIDYKIGSLPREDIYFGDQDKISNHPPSEKANYQPHFERTFTNSEVGSMNLPQNNSQGQIVPSQTAPPTGIRSDPIEVETIGVYQLAGAELEAALVDEPKGGKGYITYPYQQDGQWWANLRLVKKDWVLAQTNIQNEKKVKQQDRMSSKISVKHLFRKQVLIQGFERERKQMNEQIALGLGASILNQPAPGCLVVTTRDFGDKIKRLKRFKNTKIVTEQYILKCRSFDRLLNQEDYMIK